MATKTRRAIEESFLKIAARKPVDKITVKEIVEDCGINRNSFYYHFQDLPDLIEKTLEDQMNVLIESREIGTIADLVHTALQSVKANQGILRGIYFSKNRSILEIHLLHLSDVIIRNYLNSRRFSELNMSEEDREAIIRMYKWEMIGMIVDWMNNGFKYDLDKEFDRIYALRQGTLKLMIQRAVANKKTADATRKVLDDMARKKSKH